MVIETRAAYPVIRPGARYLLLAAAMGLVLCAPLQAAPASWPLSAADWAVPRQAETLLAMPSVAAAVRALLADPQSQLTLLHPVDEAGGLWAAELRAWLVSLGVDVERIRLKPVASEVGRISLALSPAPAAAKAGRPAP